MRLSLIGRPCALYDAAAASQTFGYVGRAIANPRDFEGVGEANFTNATVILNPVTFRDVVNF